MSDIANATIEAARGSVRVALPHFEEIHREDYGDAEVTQATADAVVQKMLEDPELRGVFKPKNPTWEDLRTKADKSAYIDRFGVDAFLDLARRARP